MSLNIYIFPEPFSEFVKENKKLFDQCYFLKYFLFNLSDEILAPLGTVFQFFSIIYLDFYLPYFYFVHFGSAL